MHKILKIRNNTIISLFKTIENQLQLLVDIRPKRGDAFPLSEASWRKYSTYNAVLPFGPFFPDFGPDPDFFHEIGPEMVRICIKKSGFDQKLQN